jgi:hypothetical protein
MMGALVPVTALVIFDGDSRLCYGLNYYGDSGLCYGFIK